MADKKVNETDILQRVKDRFKESVDYTEGQYREMVEDLEFLNGEQWDAALKADRSDDGRPCLTINKLPTFLDQIVGDQRMNRPSIKIKPVDNGADPDTADILSGLIRNIEVNSNAAYAYDTAFDAAVGCGFGVFRIITDYIDELSFEQEIKINPIENQFTVYFDQNAKEWDKSDAEYLIITEKMTREAFENQFPQAGFSDFDASRDDLHDWVEGNLIRVAEYYEKEWMKGKIYLIQMKGDEKPIVTDDLKKLEGTEYRILRERDTRVPKIVWYRVSGAEILEGPITYPGRYFPVIPVYGKKTNIQNKKIYRGLVRHSKDPQRLYNYNRSMSAEILALAPKAPFMATPKQIENFEHVWEAANKKNFPYLLYNPDPQAPMPQRQPGPQASSGIQQEIIVSDQELHDTTGLQRSALGKQSNEKSGKAIMARQREGDVGAFDYVNSFIQALTHAGKVMLDLIPRIYDTERTIRIIGDDGEDSQVPINQMIPAIERAFDFSVGRYDVVVSTGPSFTTQREEMRTNMMEFLQYVPQAGPMVMDLVAKAQDWPNADEFAERLKPPGGEEPTPEEQAKMEMLQEAEMRTIGAKMEQEEKKAEQLELENIELAAKVTDLELQIAQKVMGGMETGNEKQSQN